MDGNDVLYGEAGSDSFYGYNGNDRMVGGSEADAFYGGDGIDTVDYSASTLAVTVTLDDQLFNDGALGEKDRVFTDVENVLGGSGNDTVQGSDLSQHHPWQRWQ